MSPTFRALHVRNYRIYAVGSFISNIGTWMQNTAQAWLVLVLTNSGSALGITVALQLLPTLLLSPYGGVIADRFPKRTVLRIMQVGMAVPAAVLGALAVSGTVEVWHVYVLAFVFGVGRALEAPARQAFVAEMVARDDLGNAVALNSASFNAGRLIGPGVAGLLIAAFGAGVDGTGWVIVLNAASYGAAFLALQMMDVDRLSPSPLVGKRRRAVRDGIAYVRTRPDLVLVLACVLCLGGFGMNFQITSALMATDEFGKGAEEFGILGSILAVGSLFGALLAARRSQPRLRLVVGGGMLFAVMQTVSGLMPTFATYALVLPLLGLSVLTVITSANALVQLTSAPEMRGRVASIFLMLAIGSVPLTAPFVGLIGEELGARAALVSTGVATGLGIGLAALWFVRQGGGFELRGEMRSLALRHAGRANVHGVRAHRSGLRLPQ